MEEEAEGVKVKLKGNKWLKQKESPFATLAQEGIKVEEVIGEGAFAKVVSAYHERLNRKVAVKITDKRKAPAEYIERFLQREVEVTCDLDHPNIVKLLGIYESCDRIFLVMELCEGGDVLDFVNEQMYKNPLEIKRHFQQLSMAMYHMHQRGIVHRDLKLENLILDSQGNLKVTGLCLIYCVIKALEGVVEDGFNFASRNEKDEQVPAFRKRQRNVVVDFGFARYSVKGNPLETCCGSFAYACPEVLRGEAYDGFASDVWSMGIVLYCMFTSKLPYTEVDLKMLANGSNTKKLKFLPDTPQSARDLVRGMLDCDPSKRFTCAEILGHEWLRDEHFPPDKNLIIAGDALPNSRRNGNSSNNGETMSDVNSDISVNGPVLRQEDGLTAVNSEKSPIVPAEEPNFRVFAARRSTITSMNNQRLLTNVMQQPNSNFSKTVKKKKVALLCLGGFGKKGKDSEVSGTIKFKDDGKKKENLYNIVSQVARAKANSGNRANDQSDGGDSDDDCIDQMRRELEFLENEEHSVAAREQTHASVTEERKKLRSWKKVCGRLASKG